MLRKKKHRIDGIDGHRVMSSGRVIAPLTEEERKKVEENRGLIFLPYFGNKRAGPRAWAVRFEERFGRDEYESVGTAALMEAVKIHDPKKGRLGTIFHLIFFQRAVRYMKLENRRKEIQWVENSVDRHVEPYSKEPAPDAEEEEADDKAKIAGLAGYLLGRLSEKERSIVRAKIWDGIDFAVLSRRLGVSRQRVYQIYQDALEKMRGAA